MLILMLIPILYYILAAISHRNHYFHLFHRNSSVENRRLFTRARNEVAKRSYQNQIHDRLVTQSVGSRDFWHLQEYFK